MAVGPDFFPEMHPVKGISLGVAEAQIKKVGRKDLVIIAIDGGASLSGVFTLNAFCAAPVTICQNHLAATDRDPLQKSYLVINTGYANAGTGKAGYQDAVDVCTALADKTGVPAANVFPFSTGVIGERLPVPRVVAGMDSCLSSAKPDGWNDAARGIMTTDTRPKGASVQFELQGKTVTITGISKGAGMIRPNMATMLGFVATDAGVEPTLLQSLMSETTDLSFNQATVDGDTSTNDACLLVATGASGAQINTTEDDGYELFKSKLIEVCVSLAQAIVKDGEGATKFVTIDVQGATSRDEAREVAYTIAHSPLVKTALFASDPNWGRILAAIGRANVVNLDVSKVSVALDNVKLCENGGLYEGYVEAECAAVMAGDTFTIHVNLGRGESFAEVWTTDFSYDYVKINADYRS